MMNWPTAFVIAVAICAGGFLYNKPSDAAFGGSDRQVMLMNWNSPWLQADGVKQRICSYEGSNAKPSGIKCYPWKTN